MGSSMDSRRVDELFTEVSAVERSEREKFLDELRVTESPDVMAELESLLVADERVCREPEFLAQSPLGQLLQRVRRNDGTLTRPSRLSQPALELGLLIGAVHFEQEVITLGELFSVLDAWIESSATGEFPAFLESQFPERIDQIDATLRLTLQLLAEFECDPTSAFRSLACQSSILNAIDQIENVSLRNGLALFACRPSDSNPNATSTETSGVGSRFVIHRFLAEGGLGRVSVALDTQLQRQVAIKEIRNELRGDSTSHQRLMREAEITGKLEHPGVVPVYACETRTDGSVYYAMRLVDGKSLKEAIDELYRQVSAGYSRVEYEHALRRLVIRFVDVCQTMAYVHQQGVLHRDLKPSNIMLGNHGESLVVDWGLATTMEVNEATQGEMGSDDRVVLGGSGGSPRQDGVLGTPAFTSPEQIEGTKQLDQRSDVYSLGATLYVMLTGRRPFDLWSKKLFASRDCKVPLPSTLNARVPLALEAICLKAMSWDREDRYANCDELAEDVQRWLAFEPVKAWREPLLIRLHRWGNGHFGMLSVAVIALVMIAIASILFSLTLRQKNQVLSRALDDKRLANEQLEVQGNELQRVSGAIGEIASVAKDVAGSRRTRELEMIKRIAEEVPAEYLQDWAIRAMARPELSIDKHIDLSNRLRRRDPGLNLSKVRVAFSIDGQQYAVSDSLGNITIYRSSDDQEMRFLKGVGQPIYFVLRFSPSGRYLAAKVGRNSPVYFWDLHAADQDITFQAGESVAFASFDFHPSCDEFVIGRQGQIEIWSLEDCTKRRSIPYDCVPQVINYSPDGEMLSIMVENLKFSQILDLAQANPAPVELPQSNAVFDSAWHPSSKFLATVDHGGDLAFWNVEEAKLVRLTPIGRVARAVAFSNRGDLVATKQNDGSLSLWEFATGVRLAISNGGNVHGRARSPDTLKFSEDDTRLTHGHAEAIVTTWKIASGARRMFTGSIGGLDPIEMVYHEPTEIVITVFDDGLRFWDPNRQIEIARRPMTGVTSIAFTQNFDRLIVANEQELSWMPLEWSRDDGVVVLNVGQQERFHSASNIRQVHVADGGDVYFIADDEMESQLCRWNAAQGFTTLAKCPEETRISLGSNPVLISAVSETRGFLEILDADGRQLLKLPALEGCTPRFSPDGRFLTVLNLQQLRVFECSTWTRLYAHDIRDQRGAGGVRLAFTKDGSRMAVQVSPLVIRLIETSTGSILSQLDWATDKEAIDLCFDALGAKLFLMPENSNQIVMWDLDLLGKNMNDLGLVNQFSFADKSQADISRSLATRCVTFTKQAESISANAASMTALIDQGRFHQAMQQLAIQTQVDAGQVEPWRRLLLLQALSGNEIEFTETRSAVLERFRELASAREAIDLMIISYLREHEARDEPVLERLLDHASSISGVSELVPRFELMMALRQLRVKNEQAALNRCDRIVGSENDMPPFVLVTQEILRALIHTQRESDDSSHFSRVDFRRRIRELQTGGTPWMDRLVAEVLLRELEQKSPQAQEGFSVFP